MQLILITGISLFSQPTSLPPFPLTLRSCKEHSQVSFQLRYSNSRRMQLLRTPMGLPGKPKLQKQVVILSHNST